MMILGFGSIGGSELLLIFLVVLLIFGAKRIPEIARALGRATNEFKRAKDDIVNSSEEMISAAEKKAEAERKAEAENRKPEEKNDVKK